jgi:hypothetical protein
LLRDWLAEADRTTPPTYDSFDTSDITEVTAPTPDVEAFLRAEMAGGRYDPAFLQAAAAEMGWDDVGRLFASGQPITVRARRGYFGEVLAAALVRDFRDYLVPVKKYLVAPHPEISPPATDILGLKTDASGEVSEVCLIEVKLRTNRDRQIAVKAVDQLVKDRSIDFPNIVRFALVRLYEAGHELFHPFARYLRSSVAEPAVETSRTFLVFERDIWDEACLEELEAHTFTLEPLNVHIVLISDLAPLTNRLFATLGIEDVVDGD